MTAVRFVFAAAVVVVAVLVAPAAMAPVFNSADVIEIVAPFALGAIVTAPRRRRPRRARTSRWVLDGDERHPNAIGRLDELDGVGQHRDGTF